MEQQINNKTFAVYKASAGSGKTFRLTIEFLKVTLQYPYRKYKEVLAITFTVKATNEMKARIMEACKAIAEKNESKLEGRNKAIFEKLIEETSFTGDEIQRRSKILYKQLLHNYGDFAISTIDAFSQKIIRSFAYELQVPMQFETVIDTTPIKDHLIESTLKHVGGKDKDYTKLLLQFFQDKLLHDDSIYIEQDIENAIKEVLSESSLGARKQLATVDTKEFLTVQKQLSQKVAKLSNEIILKATEALSFLSNSPYSESDLKGKSRNQFNTFKKLINNQSFNISDTFKKNVDTPDWLDKKIDDSAFNQQASSFASEIISIQEKFILSSIFRKHFVKGQPAPFIYEKIGDRYNHLLLDEFQDTSVMQFHNLLPLITEMIEKETHPKSLVVGDSKQAIYRFRGGETEQLTKIPSLIGSDDDPILQQYELSLERHVKKESLDYNYRSNEEVVSFNNKLFEFITTHPDFETYKDVYEDYAQKIQHTDTGGYITITRVDKKEKDEDKLDEIQRRMDVLLAHINRLKSQGFDYRQIAIIASKHDHLLECALMLQANEIEFSSKESLKLNQEIYITLFPAIVELIQTPNNQVIQTKIIDGLQELGLIDKNKFYLHTEIGRQQIKSLIEFNKLIQMYLPTIDLLSFEGSDLLQCFETYVTWLPTKYRQSLFISFFRDEIMQVIQQVGNNSEVFLDWWRTNNDKLKIKEGDESKDAIQLYTIHASKGLEFDVVILPFVDWHIKKDGNSWVKTDLLGSEITVANIPLTKKLEGTIYERDLIEKNRNSILDHLNFLYVAVTRAVKELHFIGTLPSTDDYKLSTLSNMGNLINAFVDDSNETKWVQGNPVVAEKKKAKTTNTWIIEPLPESELKAEMVVQHKSRVIWNPTTVEKIEYGELIHRLLSQIQSADQVEQTINSAVSSGELPIHLKLVVLDQFNQVINKTELKDFFDSNHRIVSEQPILLPNGKEYIPDRLVFTDDINCKLLDFKTGQIKAEHESQLLNYVQILEQMGFTVTDKFIVYVDPLTIKVV